MPRQARLDSPGTLHHVMVRGIERTRLFRDDRDRAEFLRRIGPLVERTVKAVEGDVVESIYFTTCCLPVT